MPRPAPCRVLRRPPRRNWRTGPSTTTRPRYRGRTRHRPHPLRLRAPRRHRLRVVRMLPTYTTNITGLRICTRGSELAKGIAHRGAHERGGEKPLRSTVATRGIHEFNLLPIICRCSTTGPSASAGTNVNAPTSKTTPTSIDDEERRVRRQRAGRDRGGALRRQTTRDREHRDHQPVTRDPHGDAEHRVVERRVRRDAGEGAAVVVAGRREGVEDLRESMRAGIADARRCQRAVRSRRRCRSAPRPAE